MTSDADAILSLADVLPHRLRRAARATEHYDDVQSRLLYEAADLIQELRDALRAIAEPETAGGPTTRCYRCGRDGAPLYDPEEDIEVCPTCAAELADDHH